MNAAEPYRFTLLVENRTGYQNLCRLITRTKLRDGKPGKPEYPFAPDEEFASYAAGLVCLTGGDEGPLASIYRQGSGPEVERQARQMLERLTRIFGRGNVFVELQRHYRRDQETRNQSLVQLARSLGLPLLATNGVAYATEERRNLQDVLTCVHHKTTLNEAGRLLNFNNERYLKSSAEMQRLFSDLPDAFAHTSELANRLQFTLENLGYEFPRYPVPPGESEMSYLRQLADQGARWRYQPYHEKAQRQIERELAMIDKLKLPGYFLIVWDLIDFCRREKILVQGRGSAANSAVCYALGITAVDPVGMELLFERFLRKSAARCRISIWICRAAISASA